MRFGVVATCFLLAFGARSAASGQVLFGRSAGFSGAKAGESIRVLIPPRSAMAAVTTATRRWNALAGWRLFVITEGPAEVQFKSRSSMPSCSVGCALVSPSYTQSYEGCWFHIGPSVLESTSAVDVAMHELGHCLGFMHQPRGVMSATIATFDRDFDRHLLVRSGYAR
jgi:hypothetical protein